jgi:hypothetical protein
MFSDVQSLVVGRMKKVKWAKEEHTGERRCSRA